MFTHSVPTDSLSGIACWNVCLQFCQYMASVSSTIDDQGGSELIQNPRSSRSVSSSVSRPVHLQQQESSSSKYPGVSISCTGESGCRSGFDISSCCFPCRCAENFQLPQNKRPTAHLAHSMYYKLQDSLDYTPWVVGLIDIEANLAFFFSRMLTFLIRTDDFLNWIVYVFCGCSKLRTRRQRPQGQQISAPKVKFDSWNSPVWLSCLEERVVDGRDRGILSVYG